MKKTLLAALALLSLAPLAPAAGTLVYFGTYTKADGGIKGIYVS